MAADLNALYDDLNVLTEQQIEVGLAGGRWGEGERPLVERYLDRIRLEEAKARVAKHQQLLRNIEQAMLTRQTSSRPLPSSFRREPCWRSSLWGSSST